MKKQKILLGVLSLLLTTSCNDFLSLTPISEASSANYYKNATDIESAISGCYASLQDNNLYGQKMIALTELRSDNIEDINPGANAGMYYFIDKFTLTSGNEVIRDVWKASYNLIYRCNNVIANLDVVDNPLLKKQYEGEASFLRAMTYFNIVRLWGDAPLILEPIDAKDAVNYGRTPVSEIYAAIEEDLKNAMGKLEATYDDNSLGRATCVSAGALLGKVYITQQKWTDAVTLLDEIIQTYSSQYGLLENVNDIFSVDNEMNKEILFAVRWSKTITGEGQKSYNDYFRDDKTLIDTNLKNAYEASDTRKTLIEYKRVDANNNVLTKYYDTFDASNSTVGYDIPLLRWADVLLMASEAHNELKFEGNDDSKAMIYLNKVRNRAGAIEYTSESLTSQELFRKAIYEERRLELPFEMHRWFDLIRTDTGIEEMKKVGITITKNDYLYPIPKTEVDLVNDINKFPQNPGYN